MVYCWKCQETRKSDQKKISFRETCEVCGVELHVCKNCKYFSVQRARQCEIPEIEGVEDKEKRNFCEEFSPIEGSPKGVEKKILGEGIPKKKKFDDLFS